MSKEILVNQLFAGKYLDEGENIGHEVINLFKDDDGNNNLFITPSGRISGHDLEYILFVRNVSARKTVQVVGLAKDFSSITNEESKRVRYAGVSLDQIFSNNMYHGESDSFADHISFRAGTFWLPSRPIQITIDNDYDSEDYLIRLDSTRRVITPQGMREYYSAKEDAAAYAQLKAFIEDGKLWERDNTTEKIFPEGAVQNRNPSFLEVIRKEDDENIFSNLLAYFFQYSHRSFQRFAEDPKLLNIPAMSASFAVYRETKYRVDLWVESEKDIIVIENKIKSGINGVVGDYSQLDTYREAAEREAEKNNKNTHFFLFAPDYAILDLAKYDSNNVYRIVRYSDIYRFFVNESETYISDRAFPDFLRGLKRHTLTLAELQFDTMRSRLLRKINMLQ